MFKTKSILLTISALGLACVAIGSLRATAGETRASTHLASQIYLQRNHGEQTQNVYYYLVPAAAEEVRDSLKQALEAKGVSGFTWKDDSAPLWTMDHSWLSTSLRHQQSLKNDVSTLLRNASEPTFDKALKAGVISEKEASQFRQALAKQTELDDDQLQTIPFFKQKIKRWTFQRTRKRFAKYEDRGGVMDVSPMLQRPMALLWFNGTRSVTRRSFHLFESIPGVTAVPAPGFDRRVESTTYVDPELDDEALAVATRLGALSGSASDQLMKDFFRSREEPMQVLNTTNPQAPEVVLDARALPADEAQVRPYDDDNWRLLALPDGSVLAAGYQTRRYRMDGSGAIAHTDLAVRFGAKGGVRLDSDGHVWGFAYAGLRKQLVDWDPKAGTASLTDLPMLKDRNLSDWTTLANGDIALRVDSDIHIVNSGTGRSTVRTWNASLRGEVADILDRAMPWVCSDNMRFGDGLLWDSDRDIYGVEPRTGNIAASVETSTCRIFFGYRQTEGSKQKSWAIARVSRPDGHDAYATIDLSTGTPYAYLKVQTGYPSSVARSSHGRLLVTTESNYPIAVVDTRTGEPIAHLILPEGFSTVATAFNWRGDELWIYLTGTQNSSQRKMAVWNVPSSFVDPAAGQTHPDQLRCDRELERCKL